MSEAWSVVVTREPEWDDYTRAEAMADLEVDGMRCPDCRQDGTFVPVPTGTRHWTWLDGRKFEVRQYRCLACAALDTVKRDFDMDHGDRKPQKGVYAPSDGLRLVVSQLDGGD